MNKNVNILQDTGHAEALLLRQPAPGRLLYFTYGMHLNKDQLARCDIRPAASIPARLDGFRLEFYGHSRTWDSGYETVVPDPDHTVWGVVHDLSAMAAERLDAWQDARFDGAGMYFHYPAIVSDASGARYDVLVYKKDILGSPVIPSREHLGCIMEGARMNGLPDAWMGKLAAITSHPAAYEVPRYGPFNRGLLANASCSSCSG